MEGLVYIHSAMAFEEANSDSLANDIKLFNKFTWKLPSSVWIHSISWIMAISILSAANSSLAFKAIIINDKVIGRIYPTFDPNVSVNDPSEPQPNLNPSAKKTNKTHNFENKQEIDVSFCRQRDNWCYVTEAKLKQRAWWVEAKWICMSIPQEGQDSCKSDRPNNRTLVLGVNVDTIKDAYSKPGIQPLEPYAQAQKLYQWTNPSPTSIPVDEE